ncbi:MAG: PEP-CTERM sorting domain-containing protein [Tepidisphaeraceae bacterium]
MLTPRVARFCAVFLIGISISSVASAIGVSPARYGPYTPPTGPDAAILGDLYTMYTGVGSAVDGLFLLESGTTVPPDDAVAFDFAPEAINTYAAFAGLTPRSVTEADVSLGGALRKMSITVSSPGDLWPAGFAGPSGPLDGGGFGVGFNLGATLNGPAGPAGMPLAWNGDKIISCDVDVTDAVNGTTNTGDLLPFGFLGPDPANGLWDGIFGVIFTPDPSFPTVVGNLTTVITLNITYEVPEPTALALLPLAGLFLRRRHA